MRTRMSRLALAAGAVGLSMTLFAGPAGAALPKQSITSAGSDTTYFMMNAIAAAYNKSTANTNHDIITDIPPANCTVPNLVCTGLNTPFPSSVSVPADGVHPAMTWDSSSPAATPPNGSSAGISALGADTTGQISFARSSRGPNPGETTKLQFWAYALGAVDYVTFPGTDAPKAGLDVAQLIGIYTCDPKTGEPFDTSWGQVGGTPGGITKYAPQLGSGTLSFFGTKLLNGGTVDSNCNSASQSIRLEEHDAVGVTSGTFQNAIFMYDWGKFRAQKGGFEPNDTNGAVLGSAGPTASTIQTPTLKNVNETKSRYFGTRYLYNVMEKSPHPKSDVNQTNDVLRLIGVRPPKQGGAQFICSGKASAIITKAGFVPLKKFASGGIGLPASECRLNPVAL